MRWHGEGNDMKQMNMTPARRLAWLGMLAALTAALSLLESWLPPLPVPLARLGLSNLTVTVAAVSCGPFGAVAIGVFKVMLALWMRGPTAALMAACGTALSVVTTVGMIPLVRREKLSFVGVSVAAAGAHTLGQLACASWWLSASVWSYGPLLMGVAIVNGMIVGLILNAVAGRLPACR